MRQIMPWAENENDRAVIEAEARSIVGTRLTGLEYLSSATSEEPPSYGVGFDVVELGALLGTESGESIGIMWEMRGFREGLSPVRNVSTADLHKRRSKRIRGPQDEVAGRLIGATITEVALSWHIPDEASPEAIWAIRLLLSSSQNLVFALGEAADEGVGLRYQPDSVAVIFDDEIAQNYIIPAAECSAWGQPSE